MQGLSDVREATERTCTVVATAEHPARSLQFVHALVLMVTGRNVETLLSLWGKMQTLWVEVSAFVVAYEPRSATRSMRGNRSSCKCNSLPESVFVEIMTSGDPASVKQRLHLQADRVGSSYRD